MKRSQGLAYFLVVLAAACGDANGPGVRPTVASVSPDRGPLAGGTTVTITGTNFTDISGVTVSGIALLNVSVVSSTQITAVTAPGISTGPQDVVVTSSSKGTAHCTGCFTYTQFPGSLILRLVANFDSTNPVGALLVQIEGGPLTSIQPTGPAVPWSSLGTSAYFIVSGNLGPGTMLATIAVPDTQEAVRTRYHASVLQAVARRYLRFGQLNPSSYFVSIARF